MGKKCDHHGNKYEKFKKWSMAGDAVSQQAVLGTTNNQSLRLVTNDTLRMEIKPNGDVQVNKNMNIDGKLDVGTINYNSLSLNTGNTPRLLINPAGDILVNNNLSVTGLLNANTINGDNLLFKTGNQPRMSIFPDGNISINNNLSINGLLNTNTIAGENLLFKTGNLPRLSILDNGNIEVENDLLAKNSMIVSKDMSIEGNLQVKGLGGDENFVFADSMGNLKKKSISKDTIILNNVQINNIQVNTVSVKDSISIGSQTFHMSSVPQYDGTIDNSLYTDGDDLLIQSKKDYNYNTIINADNDGKVGIGNLLPQYKLDVTGDIHFTGNIFHNGKQASLSYYTIPEATNVALSSLGAQASASSIYIDPNHPDPYDPYHSYPANKANDGSLSSFWVSKIPSYDEWFKIDLGKTYFVSSVNAISPDGAWGYLGDEITLSISEDGNTWNTIEHVTGTHIQTKNFIIDKLPCRYVKLILHNTIGGSGFTISELSVIGSEASPEVGAWLKSPNSDNLFYTQGKIGIGTNTPQTMLHIKNTDNSNYTLTLENPTGEANLTFKGKTNKIWQLVTGNGIENGDAFSFWNSERQTNDIVILNSNGNVGIGTTDPKSKLAVQGIIKATGVEVISNVNSDYVFEKDYKLRPLSEVDKYIKENKHLPDIPPAAEMSNKPQNLSDFDNLLLMKIEEITLYMIEQNKVIDSLKNEIKVLKLIK